MPLAQTPNIIPALPEVFLALVAMVLLLLGVFQKKQEGGANIGFMGAVTLILTIFLVLAFGMEERVTFGGMFVTGAFTGYAKILVLLACALTMLLSLGYLRRIKDDRFEFAILMITAAVGMMMMISANDLLALYMGLELQSLSLYVLAAYRRDHLKSTESGVKYFVLGALASGMLLYGSSMLYGFTGTTSFTTFAEIFADGHDAPTGVIVGLVFVIAGLAFKVSAVPFHMWTPDVYEGAPTPVTAFFAVGPKIAAIMLFVRVLVGPFGDLLDQWQQIIVLISLASMLLGAFAAIAQTNIKRLMAYSSIGHVGFALIGLAVGTESGVRGVLVYMAIYLFMTVGTFACILAMRRGGKAVEGIRDLAGLAKTQPLMAALLAIFMFSMAGIPPLAGFFGKLYVFIAAIEAELYFLAIVGVLSSVVSAFYYVRIVKIMYFDDAAEAFDRPLGKELSSVLALSGIVVLFFFIYPDAIVSGAATAAAALFAG